MCLVFLRQLRRKPVWQMYFWDAYLASAVLRCLFDKRLIGTLVWQVHDRKLIWRVQGFRSLFGKCMIGKPVSHAVAAPRAQKDAKSIQTSLPKYQFWKPKCIKITSWSPIFFPNRFWNKDGNTSQHHPNCFLAISGAAGSRQDIQKSIKIGIKF